MVSIVSRFDEVVDPARPRLYNPLNLTDLPQNIEPTSSQQPLAHNKRTPNRTGLFESYFYFVMSLVIAAVVIYGFSQTIQKKLIHAVPPRPLLLHIHGAVFFGWVLFFILQSVLVRARTVRWHQRIGWFGVVLGVLMTVVGFSTAVTMARFNKLILHTRYPEANLLISFFDITAFTIAFALAIYWRKKPEFHRRLQLMACCALTAAAFGRFPPLFVISRASHGLAAFTFLIWATLYAGVDSLILLAVGRDLVVDRRIHPVFLYGLPPFIVAQACVMYTLAHHSAWWLNAASVILG